MECDFMGGLDTEKGVDILDVEPTEKISMDYKEMMNKLQGLVSDCLLSRTSRDVMQALDQGCSLRDVMLLLSEEVPEYKFALRSDIKDDLRFLPTRAHDNDTGWDVRAAMKDRQPLHIKPGAYVKIPLGFRTLPPAGWWFKLEPRSSTFTKKSLHALCGIVDEAWEGEAVFAAQLLPDPGELGKELVIEFGEAIGQIIPVRRQEMKVLSISNERMDAEYKERNGKRGTGGFGSSDMRKEKSNG